MIDFHYTLKDVIVALALSTGVVILAVASSWTDLLPTCIFGYPIMYGWLAYKNLEHADIDIKGVEDK